MDQPYSKRVRYTISKVYRDFHMYVQKVKSFLANQVVLLNFFSLFIYALVRQLDFQRTGDGYIWIPGAIDFFGNIPESDAVHRPFFAFLAHLIFLLIKNFISDTYTLFNIKNDRYSDTFEIISGDPAIALLSWNILNFICYLLIVNLAYKATLLTLGEKKIAFYTSTLVAVSSEMISWFFNTPIMIPGALVIYLMWYLVARFFIVELKNPSSSINKYVVLSGFIYGVLMLGKAQYNVLIAMFIYVMFFAPKLMSKLIIFVTSQFAPLLLWVSYLLFKNRSYRVYEISRNDYSIVSYWRDNIIISDSTTWLDFLIVKPIQSFITVSTRGIGVFFTAALVIAIFYFYYNYNWGRFAAVYFLSTIVFLHTVNFLGPRHMFEIGIIAYLYCAILFFKLSVKIPKKIANIYWLLLLAAIFMLNFSRAGFLIGDTKKVLPLL